MNDGGVRDVSVLGAGVVGLACGCALQRAGLRVTLIDRGEPGREASFGNAGGIATSELIPLATPGISWKTPGWLLDPLGPLAIRLRDLPQLLPWFWRFWRNANDTQLRHAAAAMASLCERIHEDLLPLLAEAGVEQRLQRGGSLTVYEKRARYDAEAPMWRLRAEHGVEFERIGPEQIHALEPDLAPVFDCAVRVPSWCHVDDPFAIAGALAELFRARQGRVLRAQGAGFEYRDGVPAALRLADGDRHEFGQLVVAAGAWSARIAEQLGDRALLVAERGYHLTLPDAGVGLNNMVISADRAFVMTPMAMGLRLAGTAEFAALDTPPNDARADRLAAHARQLFGRLDTDGASRWMGQRPSTPDSLPVIGRSPRHRNIIYAFGHGHLGLTLAATTGRLVAELAGGAIPGVPLEPFDIARFARRD